ncbi:hypothetical protein HPX47_001672 [Vibrio alginolyticus]|nr:hypothetical protein [Vibrio alginolyticus]
MADKFFKLTCNKKVSHKAVKESGNLDPVILFIKAATQKQAKADAESMIEAKHPLCTDYEAHEYSDCFKGAIIDAISEEEYNLGIISEECTYRLDDETLTEEFQEVIPDKPYPVLGNDGFYDAQGAEVSQTIYNSTDENMQAAKVFVLNVGHGQWSHGFRCTFGTIDKHERMNLDRVEETRSQAINAVIEELKSYAKNALDFVGDNQKPFLSFVLEHNFNYEFWESSEKFIHAIKKHSAYADAAAKHQDFAEVVESHFADIWPLDKSPEQAIEHVMSMETIAVLYDLEAFTEIMKFYLPADFSDKTKDSMKNIEEMLDKPAANDFDVEQRCWKAALYIDDSRYATLAIKDCGDSGWAHACALFKDKRCVFGDDSDFGDEFENDRKSAISKAVSSITEVMYKFGVDTDVVSEFARNYLQRFEENCIELGVDESLPEDEPKLKTVIRERLKMRPGNIETKEKEVEDDFQIVNAFVTESTDVDGLLKAILALPHCKPLFNEQGAKKLVEQFSTSENATSKNDYEGYVRRLLSIAGELEDIDDSMIDEIKGKLSGVFGEREFNLRDGEFYSEAASQLMNHVRSMNAPLLPELLNLRALRRLVDDAVTNKKPESGNNEPTGGNNEPKPPQNLPEQGKNKPKVTSNEEKVTSKDPLPQSANDEPIADSDSNTNGSNVPQNIVEQEPANEPLLSGEAVDEKITQLESRWSKDERESANMRIWSQVHRTDREFTSKDHKGFTSINTQYRIMQMTKVFGVCGFDWGYEEIERWKEKGAQLSDGTFEEYVHMRIALWVKIDGVKSEPITHYGSTKSRYLTSGYGGKVQSIVQDEDPYKKAESDALGKAMSMLGVCADVYLGEHDDAHIQTLTSAEIESKEKLRHLEEEERIRKEVTEALKAIKHELETVTSKADVDALESKGAAKIIALPGISEKQKAFKGECTRTLRGYCEKAIARLAQKQEAK